MAILYDDIELDRVYSRGATAGTVKLTRISPMPSGSERRDKLWSVSPKRWEIEFEAKTPTEGAALVAFWEARDGPVRAFRFYDWSEHTATNELLAPSGAPTVQLRRNYSSGGQARTRNIYAPISATVTLRRNGSNLVGISVDYNTGIVTLPVVLTKTPFTGITTGATTLLQFGSAHTFAVGDRIYVLGVSGMTAINGLVGTVLEINVPANSLRVSINSTGFAAWTSGGSATKYMAAADVIDWSGEHNWVARFDMGSLDVEVQDVQVRAVSGVHLVEVVA
jgi:uncharacterized protein (TIGR02217 family)